MINADDCWRPKATLLQTLRTDSSSYLLSVYSCLYQPISSLRSHSPDSIIHYFLSSLFWFGSYFLHQQHAENEAVSMVTCRATRGWRVVGALLQALISIGQQRERHNNFTRLMNIDHEGGALNTVCYSLFNIWYERDGALQPPALCMSPVVSRSDEKR